MADDPRTASEVFHDAAVDVYREKVAAADCMERLCALLADEDRAVEVGAKARYLASTVSAEPDWDRQTARAKDSYRDQVRPAVAAVLAALREVAGP